MLTFSRRPLRAMLLTLPLCAILGACAHQTPTAATKAEAAAPAPSQLCAVFKTIIFSRLHDTDETIRQVKASNARRASLCGGS